MLRRIVVCLGACVAIGGVGCVVGSEGDIDTSGRKDGGSLDDGDIEPDDDAGDAALFPTEETEGDGVADTDVVDSGKDDTAIFPPEDGGCTPTCTTCGASDGCGGTCKTGACTGSSACVAGTCVAPTKSYLSPGSYAFGTAWAKGITWTIGAESAAKIVYTLDGSTPGPGSATKPAPADLFVSTTGTTIKWYADNGAKEPTIHSFAANIDSAGQGVFGWVVDKVNLAGKGPVIVVSPGAAISGNAAYQAWNNPTCAGCRMQLVYGVSGAWADCLYDWSPGVWPGASGTGAIKVTAPSSPGTYKLEVTYTLQTTCAGGVAAAPMGHGTAAVATIVVK